jgi:hypothetical protein
MDYAFLWDIQGQSFGKWCIPCAYKFSCELLDFDPELK